MKNFESFSHQDMTEILDLANKYYRNIPSRARIPGINRDMTVEEARYVALYDATLTFLNKKGALKQEFVDSQPVQLTQTSSETIFDD